MARRRNRRGTRRRTQSKRQVNFSTNKGYVAAGDTFTITVGDYVMARGKDYDNAGNIIRVEVECASTFLSERQEEDKNWNAYIGVVPQIVQIEYYSGNSDNAQLNCQSAMVSSQKHIFRYRYPRNLMPFTYKKDSGQALILIDASCDLPSLTYLKIKPTILWLTRIWWSSPVWDINNACPDFKFSKSLSIDFPADDEDD